MKVTATEHIMESQGTGICKCVCTVCGTSIWRSVRGGFLWLENVPCLEMPGAGHFEAWKKFHSENSFFINNQLPASRLV